MIVTLAVSVVGIVLKAACFNEPILQFACVCFGFWKLQAHASRPVGLVSLHELAMAVAFLHFGRDQLELDILVDFWALEAQTSILRAVRSETSGAWRTGLGVMYFVVFTISRTVVLPAKCWMHYVAWAGHGSGRSALDRRLAATLMILVQILSLIWITRMALAAYRTHRTACVPAETTTSKTAERHRETADSSLGTL